MDEAEQEYADRDKASITTIPAVWDVTVNYRWEGKDRSMRRPFLGKETHVKDVAQQRAHYILRNHPEAKGRWTDYEILSVEANPVYAIEAATWESAE